MACTDVHKKRTYTHNVFSHIKLKTHADIALCKVFFFKIWKWHVNEYLTRYLYVQVAFHFCLFNFQNFIFFICVQKKPWHWSCNFCWSSDIIFFLSVQVSFEKDKVFETGICSVIYYGAYLDIYLFKNLKSSSTFSEQQQGWTIFSWRRGSWEGYVTNFTKLAWMVHLGILKV